MLIQVEKTNIPKEYEDKICSLNKIELVDAWKRSFEKTKRYKKNTPEHIFYSNLSNYMYLLHQKKTIIEESMKELEKLALEISEITHIGVKHIDKKDDIIDDVICLKNDIKIHFNGDKIFVNEWFGDNYKTIVIFRDKEELLKCIHIIKDR